VPLPRSPIGFDSSVLINFCAVRRLDVLVAACLPARYVLADVLQELEAACREQVDELLARNDLAVATLHGRDELQRWAIYTQRLDAGEAATLAAAVARGWSIAVDERAARRIAANDLGTDRITGTVGILRAAVAQDHITIDEGDRLLQLMIDDGYWSPVRSLREADER
jgi:predicted nucleic acid-binding protein